MGYVYEKVGSDHHSRQTPHFGHIDGDGDFIFRAPMLEELKADATDSEEDDWAPLRAGMFGGSFDRLSKAIEIVEEFLPKLNFH